MESFNPGAAPEGVPVADDRVTHLPVENELELPVQNSMNTCTATNDDHPRAQAGDSTSIHARTETMATLSREGIEVALRAKVDSLLALQDQGQTLLHICCSVWHDFDVIQFLIRHDPSCLMEQDSMNSTPLHLYCTALAQEGTRRNPTHQHPALADQMPHNKLFSFEKTRRIDILRLLVTACPKATKERDREGCLPLHNLVLGPTPFQEEIELLIQTNPSSVASQNGSGYTPFLLIWTECFSYPRFPPQIPGRRTRVGSHAGCRVPAVMEYLPSLVKAHPSILVQNDHPHTYQYPFSYLRRVSTERKSFADIMADPYQRALWKCVSQMLWYYYQFCCVTEARACVTKTRRNKEFGKQNSGRAVAEPTKHSCVVHRDDSWKDSDEKTRNLATYSFLPHAVALLGEAGGYALLYVTPLVPPEWWICPDAILKKTPLELILRASAKDCKLYARSIAHVLMQLPETKCVAAIAAKLEWKTRPRKRRHPTSFHVQPNPFTVAISQQQQEAYSMESCLVDLLEVMLLYYPYAKGDPYPKETSPLPATNWLLHAMACCPEEIASVCPDKWPLFMELFDKLCPAQTKVRDEDGNTPLLGTLKAACGNYNASSTTTKSTLPLPAKQPSPLQEYSQDLYIAMLQVLLRLDLAALEILDERGRSVMEIAVTHPHLPWELLIVLWQTHPTFWVRSGQGLWPFQWAATVNARLDVIYHFLRQSPESISN